MKIKAHAKINLALDVVQKREDGYHDLEMIMAPIALHDLLYVDVIEKGIEITSNSKIMPCDQRNIMYRVASLVQQKYSIKKGVKIFVFKHIPTQAGLGGGSSDGAAVIKAMNILFKLQLSKEQMAEIVKEVGADIPFCIYEKMAFVQGVGEKLQFIEKPFDCKILLVKPKKGVSTKKAFNAIDLVDAKHIDCYALKEAIEKEEYQKIVDNLQNALETPSITIVPDIQKIKEEMLTLGFDNSLMSGSGSCVFGLTRDNTILEKGFMYFKDKYYFVRKTEILNENMDI